MKKGTVIGIGVGVVVLLVVSGFAMQFFQVDPADTAEDFLESIAQREYSNLARFFPEEEKSIIKELKQAFADFGDAFALDKIEITDFGPVSRSNKDAVFHFELTYTSSYFEPLQVESELHLLRDGFFKEWSINWQNNLPLPEYGLNALYQRIRQDPERGIITANNGEILAGKGSLVAVGVQPNRITDAELLLDTLEEQLGLNPDYVKRQYEAPGVQGHWFVPLITVPENIYQEVDPVLRPIPGVFFQRVETRGYPQEFVAAHLTGYLGEVTPTMLTDFPERDYVVGEIIGRAGLENGKDDLLRGRPGYRFLVKTEDNVGVMLREKPVVPGESLALTLDLKMQQAAYEILQDQVGALVILDAQSGAVLTLASSPSYDPNEFSVGISSKRWQTLSTDPQKPMFNRALQGLYPPGSVFKVLTVAAALDQGIVDSTSTFTDTGELRVEGNIIRNFQGQTFNEHSLATAVVESINTTIAKVGLELGAEGLEDYFERWLLNEAPSLGLPAVRGIVGSPGRSKVALAWSAIGQDQVLLTPFHMAQLFTVFANGGYLPPVHLAQNNVETKPTAVLSEETVEQINTMLEEVVLTGTGRAAYLDGVALFGKTGTAEVVGKDSHAWFAGHVQMPEGRKLAFALLIEEGGVGGQSAAPLMREYFTKLGH